MSSIRVEISADELAALDNYVAAVNASRKKNFGLPPTTRSNQILKLINHETPDAERIWTLSKARDGR